MSDDLKVRAVSQRSLKWQWARRILYRQELLKDTLDSRKLFCLLGGLFSLVVIACFIQGLLETQAPILRESSPFAQLPEVEVSKTVADVPGRGKTASSYRATHSPRNQVTRAGGPELVARPNVQVPPGAWIQAKLITGASNGPVEARVLEGFSLRGERLVPEGALLLGEGASTEERLMLRFDQMILTDGSTETIRAQAYDFADKIAGLKGSFVGNHAKNLAAGIGLNFVGGLAEGLQDADAVSGTAVRRSSLKNGLLNGAATASLEEGKELLSSARNSHPIVEVPEGTVIHIMFEGN